MTCWNCKYNRNSNYQFCRKCLANLYSPDKAQIRIQGLTDYQRMKLGWYRSDKSWRENIANRTIVMGKDGKKHSVLTDGNGNIKGEMPQP